MALDRISEEIAHFIGLFHLETEAAKLRIEYQSFRLSRDNPELDPLYEDPFYGRASLPESSVKTGLKSTKAQGESGTSGAAVGPMNLPPKPLDTPEIYHSTPEQTIIPMPWFGSIVVIGHSFEIIPNSIVLMVKQTAFLSDNDLLLFDGSASFTDPALLLAQLVELGGFARSLSLVDPWVWSPEDGTVYDSALQMTMSLAEVELPAYDGLDVAFLRGEAAEGIFINGQQAEEMPIVTELMPQFLQPKEDDEEEATITERDLPPDGITQYDPTPFGVDPGHHVVTGGNRVVNETVLKAVWVDAPVIAVSQNVLRLDVISQVNVRVESALLPDQATAAPSKSLNVAQLENYSSWADEEGQAHGHSGGSAGLPAFWNVTRLEGDLVMMNWVQQHIFATDYDRVEVTFSGAATYIGTGENTVFNETLILNLGFHYDLIMVGGSMVTLNQISQINVMLDQDVVSGAVPEGANLHAGDNLQLNMATIATTGIDSQVAQKDNFAKALDDLKAGGKTLSADVARDNIFAGKEMLSVLYIDGDLIQTNVIEQVNYLGDSDQIHFIKDMFSTAAGPDVTVTSGSNAQINAAKIISEGMDSIVMAGGEVYSDALIYQVGLIDDSAAPTGVQLGALANEAVAFLADDMISPAPEHDFGTVSQSEGSPVPVDIMQTMLA
ncbi:hypothetical protein [Roseinatronobacter bogoriensis]|uniref:Type I secretion protein n=1 Tax=Roseinatronobacter bogoriensis subsp. barguzinensis TaxID=441209 RepID=A0A2K8K5U5_9RHOB|nr:hypothetical protein [Rhodobaca]ATX64832.1 hypothetical protein BG454_02415 [Rhodobaca barguzinensis]MBB4208623.1 hypothetical protein [Rhodobaca bogoriensis DSM 18756]TDW38109.1 hypothetical protein LY39_02464 [Rhodobaca barguzinensis]TDY69721.1 hypothetical protein EV660_103115 [Rhodobaca bogoriensis DSM 18756]